MISRERVCALVDKLIELGLIVIADEQPVKADPHDESEETPQTSPAP